LQQRGDPLIYAALAAKCGEPVRDQDGPMRDRYAAPREAMQRLSFVSGALLDL
jgi:hypothetical protein